MCTTVTLNGANKTNNHMCWSGCRPKTVWIVPREILLTQCDIYSICALNSAETYFQKTIYGIILSSVLFIQLMNNTLCNTAVFPSSSKGAPLLSV